MNQQVLTFPAMHADHRFWQSEHAAWHDDIARWRAQYDSALFELASITTP